MTDYIKREDAINALREYPVTKLKTAIRRLPSADVTPVRNGRWEKEYGHYRCLLCNGLDDFADNYCPNCGARMDGEEKNCDTCKHYDKGWDDIICDGCTKAHSNWERKDDE